MKQGLPDLGCDCCKTPSEMTYQATRTIMTWRKTAVSTRRDQKSDLVALLTSKGYWHVSEAWVGLRPTSYPE